MRYLLALPLVLVACGDTLPDDLRDYQQRCVRLNQTEIPKYDGDPHAGAKNVYVCDLADDVVANDQRPFPDGTLVVKDSRREGESFTWLLATARKSGGRWHWAEYTRNFSDEEHRQLLAPESKCMGCHQKAASLDYIFTRYASLDR